MTASVDVVCLLCLCVFRCFKRTWRKLSRGDRCRDYVFSLTILICAADSVRGAITCRYPYINNLLRPTVCVIFFSSVSTNLKSVLFDFRESLVILTCIFVYLLYFAAVGMFIFEGTTTGFASFSSLGESYYQLVILITTSNFPDIMLYAYNTSTWYTLYFIVFVLFGVFFLLNVLLGVIFENYKKATEEN